MKKIFICILVALCMALLCAPIFARAESSSSESIIVATGQGVPADDQLPQEYRFPANYRDKAVQFRTEDGVLLCGWVLGEGTKGITLGHANGWGPTSWLPFGERLVEEGYMVIIWAFRGLHPSEDAPAGQDRRWERDVLAAAQVLRERGATEILALGASDGGNATAVAAPYIPELVGLGIEAHEPTVIDGNYVLVGGIEGTSAVDDGFAIYISGKLTNISGKTLSYGQVTFSLYDSSGNQVGTAMDNINNWEAGGTWAFRAFGSSNGVSTYKITNVTGF